MRAGHRRYRYRKKERNVAAAKYVALILLFAAFAGYLSYYVEAVIRPTINEIAEIRARSMITVLINESINKQFRKEADVDQLLHIKTNNEGNIELVQANTQAINALISELFKELQSKYKKMNATEFEVPLGTILGSQILSQSGPNVTLKIWPVNVSRMDFKTEFVSEGINQTKYKVYAILESTAKVMAPFSQKTIQLESTVLIAEAVILGQVPDSYVVVPKDHTLDALSIN